MWTKQHQDNSVMTLQKISTKNSTKKFNDMKMKKSEILRQRILAGKPSGYQIHPAIEMILKRMEEQESRTTKVEEE